MMQYHHDKASVDAWREFYENLTYKPKVTFDFTWHPDFNDCIVCITMRVPDATVEPRDYMDRSGVMIRDHRPLVPVTLSHLLEPWVSLPYAKDLTHRLIWEMEKHEIDEWFRYKGELINDPHKEK